MTPFQSAVKFLLDHEGGYVNNPNDPGGETNYGISKRMYPDVDVRNLSIADAMSIYKRDYWDVHSLDTKPFPYSVVLFDSYVQHKPEKVDGWDKQANGDRRAFLELRRSFYLRLIELNEKLGVFKAGWLKRLNELSKACDIFEEDAAAQQPWLSRGVPQQTQWKSD
jgi:lysozyme family protein